MCPGPKLFFLKYSNILRLSIYLNQPHLEKHNHGWFSRTRMGSRRNMRGRWPNIIFKQKFNIFVEGCLHHLSTIWWRPWKTELKDIKRFKTRIPPYCSQYTVHTILHIVCSSQYTQSSILFAVHSTHNPPFILYTSCKLRFSQELFM